MSARRRTVAVWIEGLVLLALALAVRLPHLGHPGIYDEYYHALGAETLLETGSLDTERFTYRRAALWTRCVAASVALFGDTLESTRLPSVGAGALLVLATWAFGRRVSGPWAGRVAGLLVCLDFEAIYLSQIARFYAFLALAVLGSLASLYFAVEREGRRSVPARIALFAAYAALSAVAYRLNHMSAIPIVAGLAWAALALAPLARDSWRRQPRFRWAAVGAAVVVGVAAVLWLPDPVWLYGYYREAATYNAALRSRHDFYLRELVEQYPALCAFAPVALLFAFRSRPRFAGFAVTVFMIGLALHSGAGRKEVRYLSWAMPLFHLVIGIGAAAVWPYLARFVADVVGPLRRRSGAFAARSAGTLAIAAAVGLPIAANPAFRLTPHLLSTPTYDWPGYRRYYRPANWEGATPRIRQLLADRCVLVASAGVKALYHVDRLDYDLLRTLRDEHTPDHLEEFVIDHRTHKPTISEVGSLDEVRRRHPSGLVLVENAHWSMEPFVPPDVAAHLDASFERVEVPKWWRMRVYVWGEPGTAGDACAPRPPS